MIKYTIDSHIVAFPSKLIAQTGGAHIYNIMLNADRDNGTLVGRGEFVETDLYAEAAVPKFTGRINEVAENGNYRIEVTAATDALFVYMPATIAEDWTNDFMKESNFFNGANTAVRAYSLVPGDVFEVSADAFDGTPVAGATVSATAKGLYKVATA